jgi:hypothetical protein
MHNYPDQNDRIQIFNTAGAGVQWQTWNKPRGVNTVYMLCVAGGGAGGGGFTKASGVAGTGGGSGACSGLATLCIPARLLPDVLYVQVGAGGIGGAAGAVGTAGTNSYVSCGHVSTLPSVVLSSGVNAPGGGGAGASAVAGIAGTVPTVATVSTLGKYGQFQAIVGLVGLAAGANTGAVGNSITAGWNVIPFTPGASAGSQPITVTTDYAGGSITLQAVMELPDRLVAGSAASQTSGTTYVLAGGLAAGGKGSDGLQIIQPLLGTGGTGGGTQSAGVGGAGGKGAIGCGGGAGAPGTTGGKGGDGGDGLVMIIAW